MNQDLRNRILICLGTREVILPALEAAERLANSLLFEKVIDSFSLFSDFTIMEVNAPTAFHGKAVRDVSELKRTLKKCSAFKEQQWK